MFKINRAIFQNLNKTIFRSFHKNLVVKKDMDAKITTEDENNQLKSESKKNNDEKTLVNVVDGELANKNVNPGCGDDDSENNPVAKKQKLDEKEVSTSTTNAADETKSTLKKRKYALLLGYCGEGYFGLQRYQDRQKIATQNKMSFLG